MEQTILDDDSESAVQYKVKLIEENRNYRFFLAALWFAWSLWSFYEGKVTLDLNIEAARRNFQALPYTSANTQAQFLTAILSLFIGVVILMESKKRLSYLVAFLGVQLLLFLDIKLVTANAFVLIPFLFLLFVNRLHVALGCYLASCALFISTVDEGMTELKFLLTYLPLGLTVVLIFLSAWAYRSRFAFLNQIELKLRFRLFLLAITFYCFIDFLHQ
ncbi:MAG: Unknown protein [uncultured Aureispira sp.]|uniref:Uncharacterized protein n=1 Tax=uncultured Aureispira sp. TaxID=1331704 RepID=A0A6S6UDK2_9BACT|nr:MAG: Unknown protein [uncultured Aureispira sp.]